jgi:hypothetical protein
MNRIWTWAWACCFGELDRENGKPYLLHDTGRLLALENHYITFRHDDAALDWGAGWLGEEYLLFTRH